MKKNKKVFNPVSGKYLTLSENVVTAVLIKQAPLLIEKWKGSGSPLPFEKYLDCENNTPIKGVLNRFIAKHYKVVVGMLIAKWKQSSFESFEMFLEYHHTRAKNGTLENK